MRRISHAAFDRIAAANQRHEAQFFQNLKQVLSPQQTQQPSQQPQQDFQADIDNLYQLVESYGESMTLTQAEVDELRSQIEFLESYVYDTVNQPRPGPEETATGLPPATQYGGDGADWWAEYLRQNPYPYPTQFV